MIYTVTLNPSLDYVVEIDEMKLGGINRSKSEHMLPGGKGINVSVVLKNLGVPSVALGFVAGFTGDEIVKNVSDLGIDVDFIVLEEGMSRINVKLKAAKETEINCAGPYISQGNVEKLYAKLDKLQEGDVLVLAGSIPNSVPDFIYQDIMIRLAKKNVMVIVDATKDLLCNVLEKHPFLIKPNIHELGEIFGVELKNNEEIITYGKKLQERGAKNVLISMAGDGAIFLGEDGSVYESPAPKGTVVNSVGAGDSMVAGFLAGYLEKKEYQHAFKMGISAGSASAFSKDLATKEEIQKVYNGLSFVLDRKDIIG
ncbi:1-phosphofructokinase [[Clostridium] polysaccharolyticum]|uniref:Tagatose-6-phosphate kinase n=1 Tax=[Clostridium] polysaccharolyticum TaxID=29364 RepID=A0A1I0E3B4_9FIRM|nr:1-phosphofructokinase [[Clostridium] polysaccharolyticum]SET39581.1 fructose-1-phosphate kinase [[Clostridium] polysaccharolyticum]